MKKETENQDGIISEGIAKAKRVVKRASKSTESENGETEKKEPLKRTVRRTPVRRAAVKAEDMRDAVTSAELMPEQKAVAKRTIRASSRIKKGEPVELGKGLKIIRLGGVEQIGMNITCLL